MRLNVLFISPGPKTGINRDYYQKLSKHCSGSILTTSMEPHIVELREVEGFEFLCTRYLYSHPLFTNIYFLWYCVKFALKQRRLGVRYDLVATYDPIKTGIIGLLVARVLNTKFAPEVNGVYTSDAEYLDGARTMAVRVKRMLVPRIIKSVLKRADGIKLLFETQIEPFRSVTSGKPVASFANYVSTEKFKNIQEEREILFVGFPFKRKGVDILIRAFKMIAQDFPDWRLKILGWFPDLKELEREIGGHPQIKHHPPVPHTEMPNHIGSCAFVVLPSRSEAMGRVLVEAMACGKPRIGSNVDGIPTVIRHEVDGLLVTPEDPEDLASALRRLITDDYLRLKLGQASLKRAQVEFNDDVHFGNLVKFYRSVVKA